MKREEVDRQLGLLRGPGLDLLPDDGVAEGCPRRACSAAVGGVGELRVDRAPSRSSRRAGCPSSLQLLDDDAGVLARDVAEDHVALGLAREPREVCDVHHRRGGRQQFERFPRLFARGDYTKVDQAWSSSSPQE